MKTSQKLTLIGLLAIAGAAIIGLQLTSDSGKIVLRGKGRRAENTNQQPLVDQRPLEVARKLASLAITSDEQELSRNAVRVADHEVDLAFAVALRNADAQSSSQSAASRAVEQRIRQIQAQIQANEEKVKQLSVQAAKARGSSQENLQKQVELAQAELALNQDELADANEDLSREGGDAHSKLQQLLAEHEAALHTNGEAHLGSPSTGTSEATFSSDSVIGRWRRWSALRAEQAQLLQAQQDALNEAAAFSHDHDALEQRVREKQTQKQELAQRAADLLKAGKKSAGSDSKGATAVALSSLRRLSADQKNLADLDKRIQDYQQLGAIYGQWGDLLNSRQRASLHDILKSALWIILAVLVVFLTDRGIDRIFVQVKTDQKHLLTLRGVVRFTVEAVAVLLILFVIFGSPGQMSTILGLAGAGLTVALKDFIVSFFGWFVLMGRNGIRVGDWVEINGVGGEVVEIGLLRTILLETGNWTEAGHPTGRQVAFVNSFAVEGHYFNFSTSGQWLWDELVVFLPPGENPYPMIEKIQEIVAKETESKAHVAEQEWQRVTRRYGVRSFSAAPAINVRITNGGVEVTVRYINRAYERFEVRSRLNHAVVDLLHDEKGLKPVAQAPAAPSGTDTGGVSIDPARAEN